MEPYTNIYTQAKDSSSETNNSTVPVTMGVRARSTEIIGRWTGEVRLKNYRQGTDGRVSVLGLKALQVPSSSRPEPLLSV